MDNFLIILNVLGTMLACEFLILLFLRISKKYSINIKIMQAIVSAILILVCIAFLSVSNPVGKDKTFTIFLIVLWSLTCVLNLVDFFLEKK